MSIMSKIFGTNQPQQQAPAPAPTLQNTPPNIVPVQNQQTAPNGVVPVVKEELPPNNKQEPQGLDKFKTLWEPNKDKDGNIIPDTQQPTQMFNVDPAKVRENAAKLDFTKVVNQDQLKAIVAGGEGAVAALMSVMNAVGQEVFVNNFLATTGVTEQAMNKAQERLNKDLPDKLRTQLTTEQLRNKNPLFANPAAAPMIEGIRAQLEKKYPQATPTELVNMASEYVESFVNDFAAPSKKTAEEQNKSQEFNWEDWVTKT